MNLLVDANRSPALAALLCDAGYDAMHVADAGLATAIDPEIGDYADANDSVIVTVDTDFPVLIALRRASIGCAAAWCQRARTPRPRRTRHR